ncbi:hypothetical protein Tco_0158869 [Tanacetum coccineum]
MKKHRLGRYGYSKNHKKTVKARQTRTRERTECTRSKDLIERKEKKRKPVSKLSEVSPLAKRAKVGKVVKKRTVKSFKQLVDEFIDEGVPSAKPRFEDTEEAILQKVLEESLTDAYLTQRGPLPPVVFREIDTGKLQPLPEVSGKGKEKVGEEQAAQVLLHLQTTKKKSPTEQYIFQRHTPVPSEPAGHEESSSLYAELGLSGSDTESDEEMPSVVRSGAQDEGQAGPDPGKLDEGQAGPNPDDVAESQPLPTPSVLAGPNLEHSDVEITDPSSQPQPEHMDEGFIATAYPEVQENLKLTVDEQMIPEEPVSSTGTLSSLQHLTKDFSYGDQFIDDKPSEANYEKTTADTEAESMVSVTIQQDTSVIPPMTSPVIGPVPRPDSPNVHWPLPTTTTTTSATTTTTLPLPPQPQQGPSDPIIIKRMGELEELHSKLAEENQALETRLDKQGNQIHKLESVDISKMIREQTVEFIDSQDIDRKINESSGEGSSAPTHAQEETKKKGKQDSPKPPPGSPPSPPPPPPPPSGASGASGTTGASDFAQAPPPPPPSSSTHQGDPVNSTPSITLIPDDLYMDDETTADEQAVSSDDEASALKSTHAPPQENSLLAQTGDMATFMDWYYKQRGISELAPKDLEGPAFEIVKVFHHDVIHLQFQMEECHKLHTESEDAAIPQVQRQQATSTRRCTRPCNHSTGLLLQQRPGVSTIWSQGCIPALSISKMKAAYYPDVGLEQLVPGQFWIAEECKYDILQLFYQTQLNLTKPRWEATGFEFKHDYTVIDSPRAVTFRDRYGVQMIMRFNEIHKFSDGTLQQIDEALDYRVKEFQINRTNPGMNTRFWTKKDVDRSKDFMFAIQKRLKTRRIFRNLESFVGGRIREGDYRLLKRTE